MTVRPVLGILMRNQISDSSFVAILSLNKTRDDAEVALRLWDGRLPIFFCSYERKIFMQNPVSVRKLCICAIVAALYAAVTILTAPFAYGPVQFRLSEALVVLCAIEPILGVGITLGCLIANVFSTVTVLDIVVGTLATALACFWTAKCRKIFWVILPNILSNTVIIGMMLALVLTPQAFWAGFLTNGLSVALGEIAVMVILGVPLYVFARKTGFVSRLMG